tara:strand:+ start:24914 stop:27583 length:2670 start_codon:yes stop_codon:yes gene_type:complete
MPDFKKIINRNKPYENAYGQYNYGDGQYLGVSTNKDLHTIVHNSQDNKNNISNSPVDENGINYLWESSKIEVTHLFIESTHVNYDVKRASFGVYMVDERENVEAVNPPAIQDAVSGNDIRDALMMSNGSSGNVWQNDHDDLSGSPYLLYAEDRGHLSDDSDMGQVRGLGPDSYWSVIDVPSSAKHRGDDQAWDKSQLNWSADMHNPGSPGIWFVVRTGGNADDYDTQDFRNRNYQKMKLSKRELETLWAKADGSSKTFCWGGGNVNAGMSDYQGNTIDKKIGGMPGPYSDNYGEGDETYDVTSPAFQARELCVKVTAPLWNFDRIPAYLSTDSEAEPTSGEIGWIWGQEDVDEDLARFRPNQQIDFVGFYPSHDLAGGQGAGPDLLKESDIIDFRPISFVTVDLNENETQEVEDEPDLQNLYNASTDDDYKFTTAPLKLNLSFRLARSDTSFNPDYLGWYYDSDIPSSFNEVKDDDLTPFKNTKFYFYVTNWDTPVDDDSNALTNNWDYVLDNYPETFDDIVSAQDNDNTYKFTQLFSPDPNDNNKQKYNTLTHEYDYPGTYVITAIMFSAMNHEQPGYYDYLQPLRWKLINLKVFVGTSSGIVDDFSYLTQDDYDYIPWPYTTPVVSGISSDSKYVKSIETIAAQNLFTELEVIQESRTISALANTKNKITDEMGNYLGKADLGQTRFILQNDGVCDDTDGSTVGNSCTGSSGCGTGECIHIPYDMNELLELNENYICRDDYGAGNILNPKTFLSSSINECNISCSIINVSGSCSLTYSSFVKYNDQSTWYEFIEGTGSNNLPQYPRESSIGTLFINKSGSRVDLSNNTQIEINYEDVLDNQINGDPNGNKGIIISDYSLIKTNYNEDIIRQSSIEAPDTTNKDDGAF